MCKIKIIGYWGHHDHVELPYVLALAVHQVIFWLDGSFLDSWYLFTLLLKVMVDQ